MSSFIKTLYLTFSLLLVSHFVYSTHAMGGDITYRCLGNNNYEVTFSFYRDCIGIDVLPTTGDLSITNTCGYPIQNVSLTLIQVNNISRLCSTELSICDSGIYNGVEEYIYRDTVTLPGSCSEWIFSHTESARNAAITTLQITGNLYVYALLNNSNGICNNSPVFNNAPITSACIGQSLCYNFSNSDPDGDSLVFARVTPRIGPLPSDTVHYFSGLSPLDPIASFPPLSFYSNNGEFCFTPTVPLVSVISILVKEYRNGILVGEILRDIQIAVSICNNNIPKILLNCGWGTPPFFEACANQMNCFDFCTSDLDLNDSTVITWDHSIPTLTFTTTGGYRDAAHVCWMPTSADTLGNPHYFTATISDTHCPYIGFTVITFFFMVHDFVPCSPVSVPNQIIGDSCFNIFPQPASTELNFSIQKDSFRNYNNLLLIIYDVFGEIIYQNEMRYDKMDISVSKWESGFYIGSLFDSMGKRILTKKIIISH